MRSGFFCRMNEAAEAGPPFAEPQAGQAFPRPPGQVVFPAREKFRREAFSRKGLARGHGRPGRFPLRRHPAARPCGCRLSRIGSFCGRARAVAGREGRMLRKSAHRKRPAKCRALPCVIRWMAGGGSLRAGPQPPDSGGVPPRFRRKKESRGGLCRCGILCRRAREACRGRGAAFPGVFLPRLQECRLLRCFVAKSFVTAFHTPVDGVAVFSGCRRGLRYAEGVAESVRAFRPVSELVATGSTVCSAGKTAGEYRR